MEDHDAKAEMPAHTPGTSRGEDVSNRDGEEPGREDMGTADANRAAGTTTARNSTSINPDEVSPVDPNMPNMPPA